ncbi:MAG: GAF domain-containing protein [Anaerolineae bacterium]
MNNGNNTLRVLIVSGDYEIIRDARASLADDHIQLQVAYSHNDGIYALHSGDFDALIVDAFMVDHVSNVSTMSAFATTNSTIPIIGLAPDLNAIKSREYASNIMIAQSSRESIFKVVSETLGLGKNSIGSSLPTDLLDSVLVSSASISSASDDLSVTDELQTLFDLSRSLTEILDLSEVLNRVVEAARRLTGAEEGMILLPDEDGGQLYLRARVGIDIEVARNFRIKTDNSLAGRVYATGKPVLIGDQGPQKVKTEYLVKSLLYVPIIYETRCIGILGVNNKNTETTFTSRHLELLLNLASFAAIAIENARIHEETVEHSRELQSLVEASQVLNSSLSLNKTLPNICDQLMRVVNVNLAAVYEWNRESNHLQALARCFRTVWSPGHGPFIDLTKRLIVQHALKKGTPVVISQRDTSIPDGEREFLDITGVDTVQIVPIIGGDQVFGIIQFSYVNLPDALPAAEMLHRIQLMTLEVLAMLSSQSNVTRPQALLRVLENANQLIMADWCEVALLAPDQQSLQVQVALGEGVWSISPYPTVDLSRNPDIVEIMQSRTVINRQADSKNLTSGIRSFLDNIHCRAVIGIPYVQGGQTQGIILFADSRRTRVFTDREVDLGRTVVAHAAMALENAHLVYDLERSLIELKETQERLVQTARLSAMGELAAAVAHQINNPLTTIMVDSEMMLLDEQPDAPNYRSLQAIHRAGKRASGVARRLLAIARPNDPESPPERIDVVDTIQGVLSLVKAHIERDHIEIIADLPEDSLPSVWAVQGQLDDIWLNLLLNAHDALMGANDGKLGISASHDPDSDFLEVVVWDNGPGIEANVAENIFRPFFTTKPIGEGTGLGLHICRQTAERAGGSISVESTPGSGARFTVLLPVKRGGTEG